MFSFYQAYQAYERRWARGELTAEKSPCAPALCWLAFFLLRLAAWLARAGSALQQRYGSIASSPLSSFQEKP